MHFSMIALGHGDPSTNHVDVAFVFVTRYTNRCHNTSHYCQIGDRNIKEQ